MKFLGKSALINQESDFYFVLHIRKLISSENDFVFAAIIGCV